MNIEYIKKVVESEIPEEMKRRAILVSISMDDNAIPEIMEMLNHERSKKKELVLEMNMQLSRAHMGLMKPQLDIPFIIKEIYSFYEANKDEVGHCFQTKKND